MFNQFGDLERSALRPGNVHSADGWDGTLKPVVARYHGKVSRIYFRADAGFANPEVYEYLEGEGIKYAIRLPANRVLQERIGYLLKRPVGRPSLDVRRSYANFSYRAGSWTKPRRVVAKVEWHPGELYPRVGAEIDARDLAVIARHDWLQDALPSVGAVNIAGAQGAALQIAKLVEQEQRMIAGAFVMAVPDAQLLFAVRRADARIHVEHDASGRTAAMNLVDPLAGKIGKRR